MESQHVARFTISEFEKIMINYSKDYNEIIKIAEKTPKKYLIKISSLEKIKGTISETAYDLIYARAFGVDFRNFSSIYLQLKSIIQLPKSQINDVLEVGKGFGNLAVLLKNHNYNYSSLDVNESFNPTKTGSVLDIPWSDNKFDMVCAFEVLEHLPSDQTKAAINEMKRVSGNYVFLSLPCQRNSFRFTFELRFRQWALSRLGFKIDLFSILPTFSYKDQNEEELKKRPDKANPHYWEVGRKSFPKRRILRLLEDCGLKIIKNFHNPEFAYHWYVLCKIEK